MPKHRNNYKSFQNNSFNWEILIIYQIRKLGHFTTDLFPVITSRPLRCKSMLFKFNTAAPRYYYAYKDIQSCGGSTRMVVRNSCTAMGGGEAVGRQ